MTDWNSVDVNRAAADAWTMFENESRRLGELSRHWEETSTTVRARDHSLEMRFDGRGELVELVFNTSKYRAMAPAQLAKVIIETLREGRLQAQRNMAELMGSEDLPGLDLEGVVSGKVKPDEMLNSLLGPMFETLQGLGVDVERPDDRKRGER